MTIAESPRCDYMHVHEDVVKAVSEAMPEDEILYDLAELYKIFGDSTRIKILYVLLEAEMCVCDIAVLLDMTKSAVSHQLKVLRDNNLVKFQKKGKHAYYSLADDHVKEILDVALEHINE